MIASLPMYDWPEVREATDEFWAALARRLGVQVELSRGEDHAAAWRDAGLVFSQTCGYPFTHEFRGRLKLVGVPHYQADGCEGFRYCSHVFAREAKPLAELAEGRAAVNSMDSMSGMLALKAVLQPGEIVLSGGHLASLAMVQKGDADVCAIDAVCVEMARHYRPSALAGLVEVARSPLVPGLPFVTVAEDVSVLRAALAEVFADVALAEVRERLLLGGISFPDAGIYDEILTLEELYRQS